MFLEGFTLYLLNMRSKSSLYWCCQLGGWLFYGLTMVFFAFIFENKTNDILYPRIAITILVGLVLHIFYAS
jgi:two-component system LytT family sensor kinase